MAYREQSVRSQHSHIVDLQRFSANFLYALRQSLDAEEIFFRELLRQFAEKRTVAAAKIHLQARVASEKPHKIQTRNLQFRNQLDHMRKCSLRVNAAISGVH